MPTHLILICMDTDYDSLHKILKDSTRRKIILHLSSRGQLTYMELMNLLEITNTGKFNYHLKMLGNLIEKTDDGKYQLTERGQAASQLLQKFPERAPMEAKSLRLSDALLIGILGFLLLFALPVIYIGFGSIPLSYFLTGVYELLVPGAIMWWLTIRRTKNHDFYDLLKPPMVPLALMIGLIVLFLLLRVSFSPMPTDGGYAQMTIITFLILGFVPFIGVIISEGIHRLMRRG